MRCHTITHGTNLRRSPQMLKMLFQPGDENVKLTPPLPQKRDGEDALSTQAQVARLGSATLLPSYHPSIDLMMMMVSRSSFSPTGSSLPSLHLTSSSQRRAGGTSVLVDYLLATSPPPILHPLNSDTPHLRPPVH